MAIIDKKPYARGRWKQFRDEVIELDGNACRRCGRKSSEGAILHVHHKTYVQGKLPWDYPYEACETLCRGCHAREHGILKPLTGWVHVGDDDLGGLTGTCEHCGTEIRYVFYIEHRKWEPMEVGTICCDNLTQTKTASNHMESVLRFSTRRARFVSSTRWKIAEGHETITQKGISLNIMRYSDGYAIIMDSHCGKRRFSTPYDAKKAAFDAIESGEAEKYLIKFPKPKSPRQIRSSSHQS